MLKRKLFLLFITSCLISISLSAQYEIKGKINLSDDWQQQIFLATINKLDDYYKANPEDIIQVSYINDDGSFELKGNKLPEENRFYRLYLVKEHNSEFSACLYEGGEDHNFIHLILNNNSQLEIITDPKHLTLFGNYKIKGDHTNKLLSQLGHLIYPSFYFYQMKFPSELQFSQDKLNRDLFKFADTCSNIMVSLAAIINTDFDKNFPLEETTYLDFGNKLNDELSKHSYNKDYHRKLRYYQEDIPLNNSSNQNNWIIACLMGLLLALSIYSLLQRQKIKSLSQQQKPVVKPSLEFTNQESKILQFIVDGKSNKEIASALFIELSTVKTHINKLYAKLGVKSRTEAKSLAPRYL